MDTFADAVRSQERNGTREGVERGSLAWARRQIEEIKAGLRDDPGLAYSVEFTGAETRHRSRSNILADSRSSCQARASRFSIGRPNSRSEWLTKRRTARRRMDEASSLPMEQFGFAAVWDDILN